MSVLKTEWFALSVKSRHEFVVRGELERKGVETFLPSVIKLSQWKDRKKKIDAPLFPGYLFVNIVPGPEEFLRVVKTRGAVAFIALNPGCPTPVIPDEIRSLKVLLQSGEDIDIYPDLKEGVPVRIRRGVLQGAEGVLAKKQEKDLFVVNVELLGRSVGVKIYADELEAA